MFIIADFVSEEVVEVVPKKWLAEDGRTYWPPQKFRNEWGTYIKKQIEPQPTWATYPIKIMSTAKTYEEARHKAAKAKEGDEKLTSDPECYGRGKRRRPDYGSSSDEELPENVKLMKLLNNIPPIPKIPTNDTNQTSETTSVNELSFSQSQYVSKSLIRKSPSPQPECSVSFHSSESISHFLSEKTGNEFNDKKDRNRPSKVSNERQCASTPKPKKDILETILRNQKYMQLELRTLRESIDRLTDQNLKASTSTSMEAPNFGNFPLTSEEHLKTLEEKLLDDEESVLFVRKLKSFGGNNFQDHTRRVLRFLFTNELAEKYNWMGTGEKRKFSSLKICKLIVDAVSEEECNKSSRASIEDIIKNWLRHAKERKNYTKKSADKQV